MTPDKHTQKNTNTPEINISRTIDTRGMYCPIPVYKTRQAILESKPNEVVEILTDDPAAEEDITRWSKRTGNTILALEKSNDSLRFLIQKTES